MQDSQNPAKCLLWTGQVLPFSSNCIWSSEDNLVRKNPWLFFAISVSIGLFGHKQERLALVNLSQIKKKKKKKLCWKAMGRSPGETNLWIKFLKRIEHGRFGTLDIRDRDIIFGPACFMVLLSTWNYLVYLFVGPLFSILSDWAKTTAILFHGLHRQHRAWIKARCQGTLRKYLMKKDTEELMKMRSWAAGFPILIWLDENSKTCRTSTCRSKREATWKDLEAGRNNQPSCFLLCLDFNPTIHPPGDVHQLFWKKKLPPAYCRISSKCQ